MRRSLCSIIIIFFIVSISFTILLYGISTVSHNMNSLYSSSRNIYHGYDAANDVIPAFICLQQTEPYKYELEVMGNNFKINFQDIATSIIYLKDSIVYLISKNI